MSATEDSCSASSILMMPRYILSRQVQCVCQMINFALEGDIVGIRKIKQSIANNSVFATKEGNVFQAQFCRCVVQIIGFQIIIGVLCRKVFGKKNKQFHF